MNDTIFYMGVIACFVTVIILAVGIGGFVKGGEFNRKHSNRMMRWRIIAQATAVILIAAFSHVRSPGGD